MAIESNQQGFRLAAYWLTVAAFALAWTWFIVDAFEKGRVNYLEPVGEASTLVSTTHCKRCSKC
jgi:hypothetical protein